MFGLFDAVQRLRPDSGTAGQLGLRARRPYHPAPFRSVNLIVRSDRLQQDGFGIFVLDESEDDPQVVTDTAAP
jgi:hypothetical protein